MSRPTIWISTDSPGWRSSSGIFVAGWCWSVTTVSSSPAALLACWSWIWRRTPPPFSAAGTTAIWKSVRSPVGTAGMNTTSSLTRRPTWWRAHEPSGNGRARVCAMRCARLRTTTRSGDAQRRSPARSRRRRCGRWRAGSPASPTSPNRARSGHWSSPSAPRPGRVRWWPPSTMLLCGRGISSSDRSRCRSMPAKESGLPDPTAPESRRC